MTRIKNGITNIGVENTSDKYTEKIVSIGDWNMLSTLIKDIDFGLTDLQKKTIKDLNVIVRNDADTTYYPFLSGSLEFLTNQPNENRIGPTDNLVVFTEVNSTPSIPSISDLDFNLYYPVTSSAPLNFYVNGTYGSSTYLSYPYSYFIPNTNGLYTININSSLDYGVIASALFNGFNSTFEIYNPIMSELELFCDVIIYQGATILDTKTVSVGYLPLIINNSTILNVYSSLNFDYSDQVTLTLNNTDQLYIRYRFYNTGLFRYAKYSPIIPTFPANVTYQIKTNEFTADLTQCFFSLNDDSIAPSTVTSLQSTTFFQNTNFDATSYNRGWVSFKYKQ